MPEMIFSKAPGHDWEVDYVCEDGVLDTMSVFGRIRIEDALAEARYSLEANVFRLVDFVAPVVVAVRRM